MTRALTPAAAAELVTFALALVAAVATGDVALVALAAPLGAVALVGLATGPSHTLDLDVTVSPLVVIDDGPVTIELTASSRRAELCALDVALPASVTTFDPTSFRFALRPGEVERRHVVVRPTRVGSVRLGAVRVATRRAGSSRPSVVERVEPVLVEVRPTPARVSELVRSDRVRAVSGDRTARIPAEGIEFAEVRAQPNGAPLRRINWRATARSGTTCVNLHHPERSTDVVLLADTFSADSLTSVVRSTVVLADAYLARHDRVGLVCFGGVLDWVDPGTGPAHGDRLRARLLSAEPFTSYAWKSAEVIPRRLLPSGSLVVAVSPLSDDRFVRAVADLRARGLDVAVVEIEPEWPVARSGAGGLATRILTMERVELRRRLTEHGIAVATITAGDGVDLALARLTIARRALAGRIRR